MKPYSAHSRLFIALLVVLVLVFPEVAAADLRTRLDRLRGDGGPAAVATESAVFTPAGWPAPLAGDLYLPPAAAGDTRARPVMLLLHGGAWRRGDKASMAGLGRTLAERGYAAFAINYRFAPGTTYPGQLQDMQEAVRWLQRHAADLRLDLQRLGVWGYSAGGHLAALLAVQPASDLPPVRVVVAGGAPTDLRAAEAADASSVRNFMGGTQQQLPALYEQASPLSWVRPGLPPFFLYHGTDDTLVPPSQSENFARALGAAGVPVQLVMLQGLDHGGAATDTGIRPQALGFVDRIQLAGEGAATELPAVAPDELPREVPDTLPAPATTVPPAADEGWLDRLRQRLPAR
jgi:acetyl esterase/lipase